MGGLAEMKLSAFWTYTPFSIKPIIFDAR